MESDLLDLETVVPIEYEGGEGHNQGDRDAPEKHLDSPIMVSLLERLQELVTRSHEDVPLLRPTTERILRYLRQSHDDAYGGIKNALLQYTEALSAFGCLVSNQPDILSARQYPCLYKGGEGTLTSTLLDINTTSGYFDDVLSAFRTHIEDVVRPAECDQVIRNLKVRLRVHPELLVWASRAEYWSQIVEFYRHSYVKRRHLTSSRRRTFGDFDICVADGFILLRSKSAPSMFYLLTFEQLQMIQDVAFARENIYTCLSLGLHRGTDNLAHLVPALLKWQEDCLIEYDNDGFDLVKQPEAVMKAWVNTLTGGDILVDSSFNRTVRKIEMKELPLSGTNKITRRLAQFCKLVRDVGDALELFGLIKLAGHPVVYSTRSMASIRKEALPQNRISPLSAHNMVRSSKHNIVLSNYIMKNAAWPRFRLPPVPGTELRRHWVNQTTQLPVTSYDMADLDHIRFAKFLEFDYSLDFLKFLDDKAICPGASEAAAYWFGGSDEPTRLLVKALVTEEINMYEVVERLRRRNFDIDEMIIMLTQKERELKPAARCFCKLPYLVRFFFVLTEYNLREGIMQKYIPQLTMTMSQAQVKNRLYSIAYRGRINPGSTGFLEIDFSRWNLRWRARTVDPIGRELEDIYGLPGVYTQAHWFFSHATIVLTDKNCKPDGVTRGSHPRDWPTSSLVHRNHLGGFEGIIQDHWSICTVAMVYTAMFGLDIEFIMAGQGDNQIMAITLTGESTTSLRDMFHKILGLLDMYCRALGHDVKPEECIDSSTVVTYSKDFYINAVHRQYTLKFASRTLRRDESDVPSLASDVSGSCAIATLVADTLQNPIQGYWWMLYRVLRTLRLRSVSSLTGTAEKRHLNRILTNNTLLKFVLMVPGSLGGLPVLPYTRFFIKGEVDDLVWDVEAILRLSGKNSNLAADLQALLGGRYTPKSPDLTQLIADPRSLPIMRPKDQRRLIKDLVREHLPSLVRNKWLSEILTSKVSDMGVQLIQLLCKVRPLYPQIIADICKTSLAGLADSIETRFNFCRSIRLVTGGRKFISEIKQSNAALLRTIIERYDYAKRSPGYVALKAFEVCSRLRSAWGLDNFQTQIGTYRPLSMQITTRQTGSIVATSRTNAEDFGMTVGPYPPNFGTQTRQKRSEHGFRIIESSNTVKDLRALVMIASELRAEEGVRELIDNVI
ncbi:MAG: RNA-dependent RNA polymerase, partial [Yunnan mymona-like virus 1]